MRTAVGPARRPRRGRRYANLRRIERLDPAVDFDEIIGLTAYHEFPWEYVQGTSIAFMRDYGVPSISDLLDRTGRFEHDGQKRYDDTVLIGQEAVSHGLDSPEAHAAVRHLNGIHGPYGIPDHELRYVLATTLVGPKRFIDRHGYRPLHPHELEAMTRVTTRLGELMGIRDSRGSTPTTRRCCWRTRPSASPPTRRTLASPRRASGFSPAGTRVGCGPWCAG